MIIYVVFIIDYDREEVVLEKAFATYEAAKAYRDELAGINNSCDHWYKVEDVEIEIDSNIKS